MEFLYVFSVIFISTFGLAMLLYLLWYGFSCRREAGSVVVIPIYEEQSDIERLVKSLRCSGVESVILMDFGATEEQKKLCGAIAESCENVYCCDAEKTIGR